MMKNFLSKIFEKIFEIMCNAISDVFDHDSNRMLGFFVAIGCMLLYRIIF